MLEGGGQILRTSIALAALLKKNIYIYNIRGGRKPNGLKAQHITGIKAVVALSNATITELSIGTREFLFKPGKVKGGRFNFSIGTAGSIPLVLQAIMPAAAFSTTGVELRICGGTDVKWSPTIDYLKFVTLPILSKMGYKGDIIIKKRGHFPKGGGEIIMIIDPIKKLKAIHLTNRGKILKIRGKSHCVNLPRHVAERQANTAQEYLKQAGFNQIEIEIDKEHTSSLGPGSGITLYALSSEGCIIGSDALGERAKPSEVVGEEAAQKLLTELQLKPCLDNHMGDMIIPYMGIADGESKITTQSTLHTLTNVYISEQITGVKFKTENLNKSNVISVKGISLQRKEI
jgi:RNA 3'-terminal phosphate cyclase (ATP)